MKNSLRSWTILISVIGMLYIPLKALYRYHTLVPVTGTVTELIKTRTRIPYYKFRVAEYDNMFYHPGRGTLTLFKNEPIKSNAPIIFYILKGDAGNLNTGEQILYIGFGNKNKAVDVFYSITKPGLFVQFLTLIFYFTILCLNVLCTYRYKEKWSERFTVVYFLIFILLMAL
ncbi:MULTISPECIES: hypothetical protein [unclassified Sphingobacterium]|uniref:hypothetical protein n=1 Tax=unclassified Sphingobacterium TaxID=2609468 RepID=UPI0025E8E2F4|nr:MULTISPECIES: hypothetical protein [unclassified Sphingobacterium]